MSTNETDAVVNHSMSYSIKFVVLVVLQIPSILVSLIIFIYFGIIPHIHVKPHNHSILLLLFINFFQVISDLPMPMSFFRLQGLVQPATSAYYTWWIWYEFSLNTINGWLMAWISIERHLLIFHHHFIQGLALWKRQMLHIAPLIFCTVWGPLYYLLTIIISPMCINTRYFDSLLCGFPCYLLTNWGTFDLFFDVITPVFTIFLCNLGLFFRVVCRNNTALTRIRNKWRRQRKMAFQLGVISFVYLAVWIPLSIIQLGQIYLDPTFLLDYLDTFNFLVYIVPLILPIICLLSLPEIIKNFKNMLFPRQNPVVIPLNRTHIQTNNTRQPARVTNQTRF